ncbi:MAG: DUF1565 domain-containing protein, partial [Candidatus Margulisiibacteriota bacterium]
MNSKKIIIFGLLIFFLFGSACAATDYYVDASAPDNSGDGLTAGTAWKTLTYAAATSAVGDTIHVVSGTYNAALGESFPITITGRYFLSTSTGLATIDSQSTVDHTVSLASGATLEGFYVKRTDTNGSYYAINAGQNSRVINNTVSA